MTQRILCALCVALCVVSTAKPVRPLRVYSMTPCPACVQLEQCLVSRGCTPCLIRARRVPRYVRQFPTVLYSDMSRDSGQRLATMDLPTTLAIYKLGPR